MSELSCTKCEHATRCNTNMMMGDGPSPSTIMIVLDTPSYFEDKKGEIAVGDVGSKLKYFLEEAKIDADFVYITYAVKCMFPKPSQIKKKWGKNCQPHLMREIVKVRPKVIIAMGKWAFSALTNEEDVGTFRGHFQPFEFDYSKTVDGEKVTKTFRSQIMPTYSPFSALGKWEYDDYVIHDLKKAKRYTKTGVVEMEPLPAYDLVLDLDGLKRAKEEILKAKRCSTDSETTGLLFHTHEVICVGYAVSEHKAIIIPTFRYPIKAPEKPNNEEKAFQKMLKKWPKADHELVKKINYFVANFKEEIEETLKEINASVPMDAHNGKFDGKFYRYNGYPLKEFRYDTVIADALIDENKWHDLNTCMEWRGINYGAYDTALWPWVGKDAKKKKPYYFAPPSLLHQYLAIDVVGHFKLVPKVIAEIKEAGMAKLFARQQMPLVRLLTNMEYRGFKADMKLLAEYSNILTGQIKDAEQRIKDYFDDQDLEPNSAKQLVAKMEEFNFPFEKLKVKKTANGYACDKDVFVKLGRMAKYKKFAKAVLEFRGIQKLKSTYIDGADGDGALISIISPEGRIHTNYNAHSPRTGRLSSNGPNLQNWPRPKWGINIRNLFIPDNDWVIWEADFAQLELRVVAFLAEDKVMAEEFQKNMDMHSRNAVAFGHLLGFVDKSYSEEFFIKTRKYEPPEGWETFMSKEKSEVQKMLELKAEFDEFRNLAKTVAFGLNYGITAETIAEDYNIEEELVEGMMEEYFNKYRGVANFRDECKRMMIEEGIMVLPETGRQRRFTAFKRWMDSPHSQRLRFRQRDIEKAERQAMNFPVQGYANEIYTDAKLKLSNALTANKLKSKLTLSIHDGMANQGPLSEMKIVRGLVKECFDRKLEKGKFWVPLTADFEISDRWKGKKIKLD